MSWADDYGVTTVEYEAVTGTPTYRVILGRGGRRLTLGGPYTPLSPGVFDVEGICQDIKDAHNQESARLFPFLQPAAWNALGGGPDINPYLLAVITDGPPVSWWQLNDAAGPTAEAFIGGPAFTLSGTITYGLPSPAGIETTCLRFTVHGAGSAAWSGDWACLLNGDFTLEYWVQCSGLGGSGTTFTAMYAEDFSYFPFASNVLGDGTVQIDRKASAAQELFMQTMVGVNDGLWHHIVYVRQQGANQVRGYIDGVLCGTLAAGDDIPALTQPWLLGYLPDFGSVVSTNLAQMALYDTVLTPTQIATHYALGIGG